MINLKDAMLPMRRLFINVKKGMSELWDRLFANTTTEGQPDP